MAKQITENQNKLEDIYFENRAYREADYPRLHMCNPETFRITQTQDYTPIDKEIHLEIGFHRGRGRWFLAIYTHQDINCSGTHLFFNSVEEIMDYIRKTYKKNPILPPL